MSDSLHQPPAEIVARALVNPDQYAEMYAASVADPEAFWGEQGKRLDWIEPYTRVKNTSFDHAQRLDPLVRGRQAQRRGQLHRPPPRPPRRADRDHLGERRPRRLRAHQLPRAARGGGEVRQRAARPRGRQGRPRRALPADDPRGRLRHARLRPHRRGALGGLRRLLGRGAALAGRGFAARSSSSPPTRRRAAAAGPRSRPTPTRRSPGSPACASSSSAAPAARCPGTRAATSGSTRRWRRSPRTARRWPMAAEDPLFILYTSRLHRQAQGRGAHHRRLSPLLPR